MDQAEKLRDIVKAKTGRNPILYPDDAPKLSSRVITVTSGKGGVGKTNFALNLAIFLAKQNKKVVIIDADFGLANIEVLLGIVPKNHFGDVLLGNKNIDEVLTPGPMGIQFVSGGSGLVELANISDQQMLYLIENFAYLDSISDIILIDTGAGISKSVINFIKSSNETIIVTTPEPTSVTDAYAIIKTVKEEKTYIPQFKIVVNRVEDSKEGVEIFDKLNKVSERFLGINLSHLGTIPYDKQLIKAVKKQEPVFICFPNSDSSRSIEVIGAKLLNLDISRYPAQDGFMSFMKKLTNVFNR